MRSGSRSGKCFPFFVRLCVEVNGLVLPIGSFVIENKGLLDFSSQVGTLLATMQSVAQALRSLRK